MPFFAINASTIVTAMLPADNAPRTKPASVPKGPANEQILPHNKENFAVINETVCQYNTAIPTDGNGLTAHASNIPFSPLLDK